MWLPTWLGCIGFHTISATFSSNFSVEPLEPIIDLIIPKSWNDGEDGLLALKLRLVCSKSRRQISGWQRCSLIVNLSLRASCLSSWPASRSSNVVAIEFGGTRMRGPVPVKEQQSRT